MDPSRSSRTRLLALTVVIIGLSLSALLWVRGSAGESACGLSGGCDLVQSSAWARVLGVPLPVWGTAYFAAIGVALLPSRSSWSPLLRWATVLGGLGGAALLAVQIVSIGALCPFCVAVDLSAITLGGLALRGRPLLAVASPAPRWPRAVAVVVAGLLPVTVLDATFHPGAAEPIEAAPEFIELIEADGVARIVEFVDIECPFCRQQHARLAQILEEIGPDRIEVEVHHVLVPSHEHARDAAEVACCGEEQGHGRAVLDALMAADDLSPAGCRRTAASVGVDLGALDDCLNSETPAQRLATDRKAAADLGVRSLPTCVVGGRRLEGLQSPAALRDAVDAALANGEPGSDCST